MDAEKMRSSVLAYCEEVCPLKIHHAPIECGHLAFGYVEDDDVKMEAWMLFIGEDSPTITLYALSSEASWIAAYRILGLETRDAVAAEKSRLLKRYKARIKRLRADDAETHRIQMEVKDERIAELQTRNTALVAALEVVKQRCEELGTGCEIVDGQFVAIEGSDYEVVCKALAANTEKGGVQG